MNSIVTIITGIVLVLLSATLIVLVLLQDGKQQNVSAIQGNSETFSDRGKAKSKARLLNRLTKIVAIIFFLLVFAGMLITRFLEITL